MLDSGSYRTTCETNLTQRRDASQTKVITRNETHSPSDAVHITRNAECVRQATINPKPKIRNQVRSSRQATESLSKLARNSTTIMYHPDRLYPTLLCAALPYPTLPYPTFPFPSPFTLHPTPCTLHPTVNTLHPAHYNLHLAPCNLHPTCYIFHLKPTSHPTPCTRTACTLHPTSFTSHPTPYTSYPFPCDLHHTFYTLHPKLPE